MAKCWTIIGQVPLDLVAVVVVWYFIGVASICTTKILADQGVPPLVLTFQQLLLGSTILRIHLGTRGELQPLPKAIQEKMQAFFPRRRRRKEIKVSSVSTDDHPNDGEHSTHTTTTTTTTTTKRIPSDNSLCIHFGLMGVFDGLDFLSTAIGFTMANASFVETVKSSQPITTTAVACFFGIDTLQRTEALAMVVIVAGVFCSTLGNAESHHEKVENELPSTSNSDTGMTMTQAIQTSMIGITANLMFALRVNAQKQFRAHPDGQKMNDTNMLMWMQRMGSLAMSIPVILWELPGVVQRTRDTPFWDELVPFWILVLINAVCFSLYTLTNTFVLTKVSVGQHTGLNALRRMFVIVFTAVAFGVPITPMKALGIMLCFGGFSAFSYYRNQHLLYNKNDFDENEEMDPNTQPLLEPALTDITASGSSDLGNSIARSLLPLFHPLTKAHKNGT